jgi:hypothetical protein
MVRRHRHLVRLGTRIAVMAAMLLLVTAGPAGARAVLAGPADAQVLASAKAAPAKLAVKAPLGPKAPAPICVSVAVHRHWNINHVHLRNDCGYTVRVKVLIAFGPDSACEVLVPTERFTHSHLVGRFDGLVNC